MASVKPHAALGSSGHDLFPLHLFSVCALNPTHLTGLPSVTAPPRQLWTSQRLWTVWMTHLPLPMLPSSTSPCVIPVDA
jgi:hypothetical protein